MDKMYSVKAKEVQFSQIQEAKFQVDVVEWTWSGTEKDSFFELEECYLLALVNGELCSVEDIPMKHSYKGPSNKFKGFMYSQVMKLGVPFRNLFKNLNLDTIDSLNEETSLKN